ncbi:MAG: hypothetical protein RLZZ612_1545 [Pseudomonadota bacterium]|jgi:hypothetical protein
MQHPQRLFNRRSVGSLAVIALLASLATACGGSEEPDAEDTALKFDATKFTTVNVTVDGVAVKVRQYRIVYVAKPIKMATTQYALPGTSTITLPDPYAYQSMIVSVPENSVSDTKTAIYALVNNSGWWASPVATTITEGKSFVSTSDTDNIGAALKAGYVVANIGTRSRGGARAEDTRWSGKAPAPVVDVKAAVRYLRLNDSLMPGSAERIVLTGTSGGGGLTAAAAASGNSADYLSFLADVGAAGVSGAGASARSTIKDDVFAAVAYCPINNLGNADAGYEWEYNAIRNNSNTAALNGVAYLSGPQPAASAAYAAGFPAYLNSLGLTREDGTPLTAANLRDTTTAHLKKELERQIAKGTTLPALGENFTVVQRGNSRTLPNDWLTLTGTGTTATVASIDYTKFLQFVSTLTPLKTVVAFDAVGVTGNPNISGETNLFGSDTATYANFTEWAWANNSVKGDGSGIDDTGLNWAAYLASSTNNLATQLKLINPLAYLNTPADTAPYWYVRHGMIDRDTAYAMQTVLYYAIKKDPSVKDADFKLPYMVGHAGNYDVQEAFAWIKAKLNANP